MMWQQLLRNGVRDQNLLCACSLRDEGYRRGSEATAAGIQLGWQRSTCRPASLHHAPPAMRATNGDGISQSSLACSSGTLGGTRSPLRATAEHLCQATNVWRSTLRPHCTGVHTYSVLSAYNTDLEHIACQMEMPCPSVQGTRT